MTGKSNPEKIVGFTFMPSGPRKHRGNGREFCILAGSAGSNHRSESRQRMEVIVRNFHLAFRQPIHTGDGVQGKAFTVEFGGGGHNLIRCYGGVEVIALEGMFNCSERQGGSGQEFGARRWQRHSHNDRWGGLSFFRWTYSYRAVHPDPKL